MFIKEAAARPAAEEILLTEIRDEAERESTPRTCRRPRERDPSRGLGRSRPTGGSGLGGLRVAAEDPGHRRHRRELLERRRRRRVGGVGVEIDPEDVLPGALAARPRLELAAC